MPFELVLLFLRLTFPQAWADLPRCHGRPEHLPELPDFHNVFGLSFDQHFLDTVVTVSTISVVINLQLTLATERIGCY